MKLPFIIIVFVLLGLTFNKVTAQDNIGIKFFGLSIHPKGEMENAFLMPNKLNKNGHFVMNFGVELMYEKFIFEDVFSVKTLQSLYADCAQRLGGFTHIGLRGRLFKTGKHSLYGGMGPTLLYRRNWLEMPGYINPNRFKGDAEYKFQYLFIWYGGEFEYKYHVGKNMDLSASFVPGYPDLISLALGVNLRLNNKK